MVSVPENPLNDVMGRAPRIMAANGTCCLAPRPSAME
jgi:hypothetical protein